MSDLSTLGIETLCDKLNIQPVSYLSTEEDTICYICIRPNIIWPGFQIDIFLSSLEFDKNFVLSRRRTAYFGSIPYHYSNTTHRARPLRSNALIERFYDIIMYFFPYSAINSILVNYYPTDQAQLPFHADDEILISSDSFIFTLSLGSSRQIAFRDAKTRKVITKVWLAHGDLCIFSRNSQDRFQHSILPNLYSEPADQSACRYRISLTFRSLKV